jgi:hypothetical protein
MGLTADNLIGALGACCGEQPQGPAEAVLLVRRVQPSFAGTLYSAWQREGRELSAGLRYDVDVAQARVGYYRSVARDLATRVPGLTAIKGLEVADLYPDGLVRAMNDLDYVASAERDLWQAVTILVADEWEIDTATFGHVDGALQVMVSLKRRNADPYQLPYGVELATYYTLGNLAGVPPVLKLPAPWRLPAIKNMLMLMNERFEQPYRARDLVDAHLLLSSAASADVAALHEAVGRLRLRSEYAELVRLVDRAGLGPLPAPPGGELAAGLTRASRIARDVGFLRRPLAGTARHLQRRRIFGTPGGPERLAWAATQLLLPTASGMRAGLVGFGLPLEGPAPEVDAAVLRTRGKLVWADTPVARFLLTVGDDVSKSAVDQLSGPDPVRSPAMAAPAETAG